MQRRGARAATILLTVVVLGAGCGGNDPAGDDAGPADATVTTAATTTAPADAPPCYGLEEVDAAPDWGAEFDSTWGTHCAFDSGVWWINEEATFWKAFVETDCQAVDPTVLPNELRPAVGAEWLCIEFSGGDSVSVYGSTYQG